MEIKYKHADFNKLVDAFCRLNEIGEIDKVTTEDLKPLLDYPVPAIDQFLKAIGACTDEMIEKLETDQNYRKAIEIYVLMRMNLAEYKPENPDI